MFVAHLLAAEHRAVYRAVAREIATALGGGRDSERHVRVLQRLYAAALAGASSESARTARWRRFLRLLDALLPGALPGPDATALRRLLAENADLLPPLPHAVPVVQASVSSRDTGRMMRVSRSASGEPGSAVKTSSFSDRSVPSTNSV